MAKREGKAELVEVKALLGSDPAYLRTMVRSMVQAALGAEMTEFLGASRWSGPASVGATGAATTSAG